MGSGFLHMYRGKRSSENESQCCSSSFYPTTRWNCKYPKELGKLGVLQTNTASVLHKAMGYIRFLQEHVQVLCSPYLQRLEPPSLP